MSPIARDKLVQLVTKRGRSIIDDHKRCEALLSDVYGDQHRLELFVLLAALKERIPSELVSGSGGVSREVLFGKLATRLAVNKGFKEELALWGVESWGIALGVLSESPKDSERKDPQSSTEPTRKGTGERVPDQSTQQPKYKLLREVDYTFPRVKPQHPSTSNTSVALWRVGVIGVLVTALLFGISTCRKPKIPAGPDMRSEERLTNTLGMVFTRVPGGPMFSIWDVRVMDYGVYAAANSGVYASWKDPGFVQGPDHPVVKVSWNDAQAFCTWLTKKERGQGKIKTDESYRLPTDAEWSMAVGLEGEFGGSPKDKDGKIKGVYPWGRQWPPPKNSGNYHQSLGVDAYDHTSPVGSFQRNGHGLFDMGGNVWQWCEDRYEGEQISRVLRGASWHVGSPDYLLPSYRNIINPGGRGDDVGFRCVLVGDTQVHPQPPSTSNSSFEEESRKASSPTASPTANSSVGIPSGGLFTNTLGMVFTRVPGGPMFSIWDVRVIDYKVYAAANPGVDASWKDPGFVQGPDHPVVKVSWDDAQAFCAWLTKKERGEGRIRADQRYRLPTDAEWSVAVGLEGEVGSTPREKDGKIKGVYPWGRQWPPPKNSGNYHQSLGVDAYDHTSPVGSFQRNEHGLFDMGGNVWQWCEDRYEGEQISRVLRGASWFSNYPFDLLSSFRIGLSPDVRHDIVGFRCVLVGGGSL